MLQSRRFQFILKRLLLATAVIGLLLALVTHRDIEYQRSTASADAIAKLS
jgi:hypothetical protein